MHERRSQPESAAGEPTPLSAPQAGIFRSGPRATRSAVQPPCSPRSDLAHAALNSAAAQPLVAHELVKEQACFSHKLRASDFLLAFFFQAEDGIRDAQESRGLGDVYKRQAPQGRFSKKWLLFALIEMLVSNQK